MEKHSRVEEEGSTSSRSSTSSTLTDLMDDASSPKGPLYELSELVTHLPIKRGLSKYYEGKSESFKSLSSVKGLEELAKKENPYNKRMKMKMCRSHERRFCTPKPIIAKKASRRGSFLSSSIYKSRVV